MYTDKMGNEHKYEYTPYYEMKSLQVYNPSGKKWYSQEIEFEPSSRLLKKETNSDGHSVEYRYDAFRRLNTLMTMGKTYRVKNQAASSINPYDINDLDDLMDSFTYSDGQRVSYRYDTLGRLKDVEGSLVGNVRYQYATNTSGVSVSVSFPNGVTTDQQLNSFGEVVKTSDSTGRTENNQYDAFGNIVETRNHQGTWKYRYDKIDRIEEVEHPNAANPVTYEYDELGNRKNVVLGDFPMPTDEREYKYDGLNRLTQVKEGSQTTDYTYYPNGLRATKENDEKTARYVYLNRQVVEELDGSGRIQEQNVYGNGLLLRKDAESGKAGYYLTNSTAM